MGPVAYFITFSTYGAHLQGSDPLAVDRHHNLPGGPFVPESSALAFRSESSMRSTPYTLSANARAEALQVVLEVCAHFNWVLLAAHVRTNHVHLVVCAAGTPPETIMTRCKAFLTRRLRALEGLSRDDVLWARHGSTRYVWLARDIPNLMRYVVEDQGEPMAVYLRDESLGCW